VDGSGIGSGPATVAKAISPMFTLLMPACVLIMSHLINLAKVVAKAKFWSGLAPAPDPPVLVKLPIRLDTEKSETSEERSSNSFGA